jgi:hypothetical protein
MITRAARTTANAARLLALAALVLGGCASAQPTPITSLSEIAGNWQGTITRGFNGPQEFYYLTIHPDGSMVAQWGLNWEWGRVTVAGGAATFEMRNISTGPLYYYGGPGTRLITMEPLFGGWYVRVSPVR